MSITTCLGWGEEMDKINIYDDNEMPDLCDPNINFGMLDELSLVDADLRELFEGKSYYVGTPLVAQLIREIRLLRESFKKTIDSK